jgi:hypothetical protein
MVEVAFGKPVTMKNDDVLSIKTVPPRWLNTNDGKIRILDKEWDVWREE